MEIKQVNWETEGEEERKIKEEKETNVGKRPLSAKTKIAIWWIVITGGLLLVLGVSGSIWGWSMYCDERASLGCLLGPVFILWGVFLFFPSVIFLRIKKKWAWILTFITDTIFLIFGFIVYLLLRQNSWSIGLFFLPIVALFPLILLLLDRKNFWKVAR